MTKCNLSSLSKPRNSAVGKCHTFQGWLRHWINQHTTLNTSTLSCWHQKEQGSVAVTLSISSEFIQFWKFGLIFRIMTIRLTFTEHFPRATLRDTHCLPYWKPLRKVLLLVSFYRRDSWGWGRWLTLLEVTELVTDHKASGCPLHCAKTSSNTAAF